MPKDRQLNQAIVGYLLLFWAAGVYASDSPFGDTIRSVDRDIAFGITIMSGVGGMGGTISKIAKPVRDFTNVYLEVAKDLFSSQIMGWLAYFGTTLTPLPPAGQIIAVICAGICGSKLLDKLIEVGPSEIIPFFLSKFTGRPVKDETP